MDYNEEQILSYIKELKSLKAIGGLEGGSVNEIDSVLKLAETLKDVGPVTKTTDKFKLNINYQNKSSNKNPSYAKEGDSGFDLRANESGTLDTLERKLVSTGLYFELPSGYELQIRPRSGMAYKNGVTVLNTPGTVDTGYRGEVKVLLINLSNETFTFEKGDRIAQGVIMNRVGSEFADLVEVTELSKTNRGDGGFGSTGIK